MKSDYKNLKFDINLAKFQLLGQDSLTETETEKPGSILAEKGLD